MGEVLLRLLLTIPSCFRLQLIPSSHPPVPQHHPPSPVPPPRPPPPLCFQRYLVPPNSEPFEDSALSAVLAKAVTTCPSVSSIQNFVAVVPVLVGLF